EVRQGQRPHGMVGAEAHDDIDVLPGAHALIEAVHRFIDHGHEDAVDEEPGIVTGLRRGLAELEAQVPGQRKGLLGSGQRPDQLHQLHHRRRVHEVHADDLAGSLGLGGYPADGDGRGVAGQDGRERADGIQLPEDLELQRLVFRGRLDHHLRPGHIPEIDGGPDAAENRVQVPGAHLALLHTPGQVLADGLQAPLDQFLGDIADDHRQTAHGRHLGDAAAHLAGADNANGFYLHPLLISFYAAVTPGKSLVGARLASPVQSTREKRGTTPGPEVYFICSTTWCPSFTFLPISSMVTLSGWGASNSPVSQGPSRSWARTTT